MQLICSQKKSSCVIKRQYCDTYLLSAMFLILFIFLTPDISTASPYCRFMPVDENDYPYSDPETGLIVDPNRMLASLYEMGKNYGQIEIAPVLRGDWIDKHGRFMVHFGRSKIDIIIQREKKYIVQSFDLQRPDFRNIVDVGGQGCHRLIHLNFYLSSRLDNYDDSGTIEEIEFIMDLGFSNQNYRDDNQISDPILTPISTTVYKRMWLSKACGKYIAVSGSSIYGYCPSYGLTPELGSIY